MITEAMIDAGCAKYAELHVKHWEAGRDVMREILEAALAASGDPYSAEVER